MNCRIEALEQRRLLSADLQGALTVSVGAFLPGSNASGAFKILNNGTSTVTTDFDVNFRLSKNTVYGDSDELPYTERHPLVGRKGAWEGLASVPAFQESINTEQPRRVLHIEYAGAKVLDGLSLAVA